MIPAQLVDVDLELDVLSSIPRDPRRALRIFVIVPAASFAYGPHRYLYVALRALPTPNLRVDAAGDWHVHGLVAELEALHRVGSPELVAGRLYDAIDAGPLLPFGESMVERLLELHRRRRYWRTLPDLEALELELPELDRADALRRAYLEADTVTDVADLELELAGIAAP